MKKIIALLLVLAMALSLVACSSGETSQDHRLSRWLAQALIGPITSRT